MAEDKTEILVKKGLMGDDLTHSEAARVAERLQDNTDALARFLAIEDQLDDIIKAVDNAKKAVKWLIGFLVLNYGATFHEAILSVIM